MKRNRPNLVRTRMGAEAAIALRKRPGGAMGNQSRRTERRKDRQKGYAE